MSSIPALDATRLLSFQTSEEGNMRNEKPARRTNFESERRGTKPVFSKNRVSERAKNSQVALPTHRPTRSTLSYRILLTDAHDPAANLCGDDDHDAKSK
jgi:hypothetical protein